MNNNEIDIGKVWNSIHWGKRNIVEEKGQELVKPLNNEVNKKIAEEIAKRVEKEIQKRSDKEWILKT